MAVKTYTIRNRAGVEADHGEDLASCLRDLLGRADDSLFVARESADHWQPIMRLSRGRVVERGAPAMHGESEVRREVNAARS